eukprot:1040058-Rhodomonas_salina.7
MCHCRCPSPSVSLSRSREASRPWLWFGRVVLERERCWRVDARLEDGSVDVELVEVVDDHRHAQAPAADTDANASTTRSLAHHGARTNSANTTNESEVLAEGKGER